MPTSPDRPALPDDPVALAVEVSDVTEETIDHAWLERLKPQMSGWAPAPAAMIAQAQEGIEHTVSSRALLPSQEEQALW